MKELGIYDDALIIIHADHGGRIPPIGYINNQPENGFVVSPMLVGAASPLLAIKRPDSQGELQISGVLASLTDIPDTVSSIMKWDEDFGGEDITKINSAKLRTRKFYNFDSKAGWETAKHSGPIHEITIIGRHFDSEWQKGKVFSPP